MGTRISRRLIKPNPVNTDSFDLGQTKNNIHVARSRANFGGLGDFEKSNWAHKFAIDEAVQQMIHRTKNALKVNPFFHYVFFKLNAGRRCSCFGKGETPDGYCISCFQVGNVGGYEKFSCRTDMIEATRPGLSLINVLPDTGSGIVPTPLTLGKKALKGVIETKVDLLPNVGILDLFKVHSKQPPGSSVNVLIKKTIEVGYVPATFNNVQERLQSGILQVRIELTRENLTIQAPYLKAVRLRYQIQPGSTLVPFNIPLPNDSAQLADLGIFETFQSLTFFTDNTVKSLRNGDWMLDQRTGRKFKIIDSKQFNPTGVNVSWFVTGRFAQDFDPISDFL